MDISINGVKADIILESEKIVGEVLAGLEQWLTTSDPRYSGGLRLSGLVIDGMAVNADSLEASFKRDIASVASLDITVRNVQELLAEALLEARQTVSDFKDLGFAEKQGFADMWKANPAAGMLLEQSPELYEIIANSFSGEGLGHNELTMVIDERLRELRDPSKELKDMERLIAEVSGRLEELPLDIQTGRDRRAVETVQYFSGIAGKVFRIFNLLKTGGFPVDEIIVAEMPVSDYVGQFSGALRELLEAYEQKDTVLVGDLAEYELAPRLRGLYAALAPFTEAA
jgi:hypothetical protein